MAAHIPVWVYFIFVALVALGWRQARTRIVPVGVVSGVALGMLGLSLYGVIAAFGARPAPLVAWALGMAVSIGFGRGVLGPRGLVAHSASRVQVPGSWLPLVLMMAIFIAKFALGFAIGMRLPVIAAPWFVVGASFVFGVLSGAFAARAVVVQQFMRGLRCAPVAAVVQAGV